MAQYMKTEEAMFRGNWNTCPRKMEPPLHCSKLRWKLPESWTRQKHKELTFIWQRAEIVFSKKRDAAIVVAKNEVTWASINSLRLLYYHEIRFATSSIWDKMVINDC